MTTALTTDEALTFLARAYQDLLASNRSTNEAMLAMGREMAEIKVYIRDFVDEAEQFSRRVGLMTLPFEGWRGNGEGIKTIET